VTDSSKERAKYVEPHVTTKVAGKHPALEGPSQKKKSTSPLGRGGFLNIDDEESSQKRRKVMAGLTNEEEEEEEEETSLVHRQRAQTPPRTSTPPRAPTPPQVATPPRAPMSARAPTPA
jgi:hypothetical protein